MMTMFLDHLHHSRQLCFMEVPSLIPDEHAEAIAMHERIRRLELGGRRGFGSVKVMAMVGETRWKTSVFPSKTGEWWLLVGKKVLKALA